MERFHTHGHAWTGRSPAYHTLGTLQAETPFILFLIKDGKGGFPQSRPATEVTAARTSGLDNLVFSRQTVFSRTTFVY